MDDRGFGLQETLLVVGLLMFLLIIVYIYGNREFGNIEDNMNNDTSVETKVEDPNLKYKKLERTLIKASKKYSFDKDETIIISLDKLKQANLIKEFKDTEDNECRGYVIYNSSEKDYKAYIRCADAYTTDNYNVDFE